MLACVDREVRLADAVIKPDAGAIKRRRLGAKPWRAHEESATEPEPVSHTPKGRRRSTGGEDRSDPVFQPNNGDVTQTIQAPDLPGRFSFLTNKPASLPPRRMNLLRNEPLDVLQKV